MPKTLQIQEEYLRAEIFVLSSRYEGFPNVLVEAMSQGLPCIATDEPGAMSDIFNIDIDDIGQEKKDSERLGILIPNDSKEHLVKALQTLMKSTEERNYYSKKVY